MMDWIYSRSPRWWYGMAMVILLILMFCSCSSQIEVVKPEVHEKIEYRDRVQKDTIMVKDSVMVMMKADTVFMTKWKYIYKEHVRIDTSYVYKTDTITKIMTVEKKLGRWDSLKLELGGLSMGFMIMVILATLAYIAYVIWKR